MYSNANLLGTEVKITTQYALGLEVIQHLSFCEHEQSIFLNLSFKRGLKAKSMGEPKVRPIT